jgi:hypothetical protein
MAMLKINAMRAWMTQQDRRLKNDKLLAHYRYGGQLIDRFLDHPSIVTVPAPMDPPAGSPIGMGGDQWCGWNGN